MEPRRYGKSAAQYRREVREYEADEARTANYNHRLAESIQRLWENPNDGKAIKARMERDFLATYDRDYRSHSVRRGDATAKTILCLAALAVVFAVVAACFS